MILTEIESAVTEYVSKNPDRTTTDISIRFNLNQYEARLIMNGLVADGILVKITGKRSVGNYYRKN